MPHFIIPRAIGAVSDQVVRVHICSYFSAGYFNDVVYFFHFKGRVYTQHECSYTAYKGAAADVPLKAL